MMTRQTVFLLLFVALMLSQLKLHISSLASISLDPSLVSFSLDPFNDLPSIAQDDLPTKQQQEQPLSTPFCNSLAYSRGATKNRRMVHAFVSNSGHWRFLENALLSMASNRLLSEDWIPVVFALGRGVCPKVESFSQNNHNRKVLCIPYIQRLLQQLQRDEPKSIEQMQPYLRSASAVSSNNNVTTEEEESDFSKVDHGFHTWGSIEHKFMINAKLYALRDILECHTDAFVTDVDVAFVQDPRPYFSAQDDTIFAQNDTSVAYQLSLNSGLMYWKSTDANRKLIHDIITIPPFWWIDQSRVNTVMHNQSTPHVLLKADQFPNGNIIKNFQHRIVLNGSTNLTNKELVVIAHANWNVGSQEKQTMLESIGLWYLKDDEGSANEAP